MSYALLYSVILKLHDNYGEDHETHEEMERVIEELREILHIMGNKQLEDGRRLNFLVCDLVDVVEHALRLCKRCETYYWESIHSWIGEIKKRMRKLGDDGVETESNMTSSENDDDEENGNYAVGLDEDVEMLLRTRIFGGEYYLKTVLIKGMAGIGKTTLAREIYNHPIVVERFERRAWVSNSTHLTLKELLIKLIQQVEDPQNLHTSSLLENMDNPSLRDMLSQHLQEKRYLIVLDDMPKQMHLASLVHALPKEYYGSRLLLTSHTMHIGVDIDDENVHQMKPLDSKKSWKLFLKTMNHGNKLTGEHKFPMSLEHMGKQMLRKCGGLPLAIKEVGKQLVEKKLSRILHGRVSTSFFSDISLSISESEALLLYENWYGFGLAELLESGESHITTRVMRTFGYLAPEYANTDLLNEKSDKYSFGVLLLEAVTGRDPVDYTRPANEVNLVEWLKMMVGNSRAEEVVGSSLEVRPTTRALNISYSSGKL